MGMPLRMLRLQAHMLTPRQTGILIDYACLPKSLRSGWSLHSSVGRTSFSSIPLVNDDLNDGIPL